MLPGCLGALMTPHMRPLEWKLGVRPRLAMIISSIAELSSSPNGTVLSLVGPLSAASWKGQESPQ